MAQWVRRHYRARVKGLSRTRKLASPSPASADASVSRFPARPRLKVEIYLTRGRARAQHRRHQQLAAKQGLLGEYAHDVAGLGGEDQRRLRGHARLRRTV